MRLNVPLTLILFILAALMAYLAPSYLFESSGYVSPTSNVSVATTTPEESSNLTYYIEAERVDPIFAIEGTDPAKLRTALQSLFAERDQITQLYSGAERTTIEATLYPKTFLTALPNLEEARQTMLAEPSVVHAKKYHAQLVEAIGLYAAGARALAGSMSTVANTIPSIGFIGGTASTSDMVAKIKMVAHLALAQKKKEEARFTCFEHSSANCPTIATLQKVRDKALADSAVLPGPTGGVYKADALSQQILPLLTKFTGLSNTLDVIPSSCFPGSVAYVREYYSEQIPNQVARKQNIVNDVYFYDMQKEILKDPTLPLYQELTKAGVALQYQNVGNLYMCPDSGLEVSSIGSVVGVRDALLAKTAPTPVEQTLLSLPVLQQSDVAAYVRARAQTNTNEGDALAERYIEGSENFDQVVMGMYSDNHFLITWDKEQHPVQFEYMLMVRSFASTLFFMGNPTFVPQKISLFSSAVPNPLERLYLREYLNDASKQYTDAQIMDQVKKSIDIDVGSGLRVR